jgi:hypothetical protein
MILIFGFVICLLIAAATFRILAKFDREDPPATGLDNEEPLRPADYDFLAEHPRFNRAVVRELRRERRKVLRQYLRCLRDDFRMVSAQVRLAIVQSAGDRPDLSSALARQQFRFMAGLARAECSMWLEAAGLGAVDFDDVIERLSSIRMEALGLLHPDIA